MSTMTDETLTLLAEFGNPDTQDLVREVRRLRVIEKVALKVRDDLKRTAGEVTVALEAELDEALFPELKAEPVPPKE